LRIFFVETVIWITRAHDSTRIDRSTSGSSNAPSRYSSRPIQCPDECERGGRKAFPDGEILRRDREPAKRFTAATTAAPIPYRSVPIAGRIKFDCPISNRYFACQTCGGRLGCLSVIETRQLPCQPPSQTQISPLRKREQPAGKEGCATTNGFEPMRARHISSASKSPDTDVVSRVKACRSDCRQPADPAKPYGRKSNRVHLPNMRPESGVGHKPDRGVRQ
jgi:hypothetical protein